MEWEKMIYNKDPVPLSKMEKKEAVLLAIIVVLAYTCALGYYLS